MLMFSTFLNYDNMYSVYQCKTIYMVRIQYNIFYTIYKPNNKKHKNL